VAARKERDVAGKAARRATTITLAREELVALGRLIAVGQVVLQQTCPVVVKIRVA